MTFGSKNSDTTNFYYNYKEMKKLRILFVLALLLQVSSMGFAQGKWGKDSAECVKYIGFYRDSYKQDNMAEAYPNWKEALKYCPPGSSQYMWIDGQKILKFFLNNPSNSAQRKKELIDSLMMMHEMRKQYFPKYTITAQANKVFDMNFYDVDAKSVFAECNKAIEISGEAIDPAILVIGLQKAVKLYQDKVFTPDVVMDFYTKGSSIFKVLDQSQNAEIKKQAADTKGDFESLFANSGVASCENIVALYTPTFEANKTDKDYVSRVVYLLERGGCNKEDLFAKAVESLNKIEPSAKTSYYLFKLYVAKDMNIEALKFLQQAIDSPQTTETEAADYLLEMGKFYFKIVKNNVKAVESAKLAAQKNPALSGEVNMLIASVWATIKCGGDDISSRANFWVAVDYLIKAKNADPKLAEDADKLIASYRQYFPLQEDAFMSDILDGTSYTVTCGGFRETTTVRTRK